MRLGILSLVLVGVWTSVVRVPAADFLRGDVDGSGRLSVSDAIRILAHLFQGDASAVPCLDAADTDDSGAIDLADPSTSCLVSSSAVPFLPLPFPRVEPIPPRMRSTARRPARRSASTSGRSSARTRFSS